MLFLLACSGPEPAPPEMGELTKYFWEQWDDEEAMQAAVEQLLVLTQDLDFEADVEERSHVVFGLDPEAVGDKVLHDNDPADTVGAGVLHQTPFSIVDHFEYMWQQDQTPFEPSSDEFYQRTFLDGSEECIREQTCQVLLLNEVQRDTVLYTIRYDIHKQFRWSGDALVGRSWNLDEAEDGAVVLKQGYSLDIFVPNDSGTIRYHLSWQETEPLDDEDITGALMKGIDDLLTHHDAWLEDNL